MPSSDNSLPPTGQILRQAFESLITALSEREIRYVIVGGIATLQHTRVRTTDDIDALPTVPQIELPGLFETLRERGFTIDVVQSIREFRDGMTTILFQGVRVVLLRPLLPAYTHVLERAITANILDQTVRISAAEGLIVMKLMAMRPQDQTDIRDLLAAYASQLDLDFIRSELDTFTESDDPRRAIFESWIRQTARDG